MLRINGRSLVAKAVETFLAAGLREIIVVTGRFRKEVETEVENLAAMCVFNPLPDSDMIDSARIGLRKVSAVATACMFLPVDCALVSPETVKGMISIHEAIPGKAIRPYSGRKGGHPLLVPRAFFRRLVSVGSLREVYGSPDELIDMRCGDKWAFLDLDTYEDYEKAVWSTCRHGGLGR